MKGKGASEKNRKGRDMKGGKKERRNGKRVKS